MIYNHEHPIYIRARERCRNYKWNGAYYYSKEICDRIIPNIKTDRNWITLNFRTPECGCDHAIVFVHNHRNCPKIYKWLRTFDDLVFVCSERADMPKLEQFGKRFNKDWKSILLPLSVDVEYVKQFRKQKTKDVAFCGREQRQEGNTFPDGTDFICNMPREQFLSRMAEYRKIYAVDRVAIEGLILGCEILPYDKKHPDASKWRVIDNLEASVILQQKLDEIDH